MLILDIEIPERLLVTDETGTGCVDTVIDGCRMVDEAADEGIDPDATTPPVFILDTDAPGGLAMGPTGTAGAMGILGNAKAVVTLSIST